MRITRLFYITIISLFGFMCCHKTSEPMVPVTPSNALNDMIGTADIQAIAIDEFEQETIQIGKNDILYSTYTNNDSDTEPVLGFLKSIIYTENQFYIYDSNTNATYTLEENGSITGPYTREGRGPGEHLYVENLSFNSDFIYATDLSNGRINVYSPMMEPVKALEPYSSWGGITVNDEIILHLNERSSGFVPSFPEEGLVVVSSVKNLSDTLATLMPRIIPAGYQPQVYNEVKYSLNNRNQIVASYSPLPWFFIFNNQYEHINTVILEYSAFDELDIPTMDFFKPKGNEGYGGQMPVHSYKLMDNGDLFITLRRELLHLTRENNSYQLKGRYSIQYQHEDEIHDENSFTWVFNQVIKKTAHEIYVYNPGYLYHFEMPLNESQENVIRSKDSWL